MRFNPTLRQQGIFWTVWDFRKFYSDWETLLSDHEARAREAWVVPKQHENVQDSGSCMNESRRGCQEKCRNPGALSQNKEKNLDIRADFIFTLLQCETAFQHKRISGSTQFPWTEQTGNVSHAVSFTQVRFKLHCGKRKVCHAKPSHTVCDDRFVKCLDFQHVTIFRHLNIY